MRGSVTMGKRINGFIVVLCGIVLTSCSGPAPVADQEGADVMPKVAHEGSVEESSMDPVEKEPTLSTEEETPTSAPDASAETALIGPIEDREIFCAFKLDSEPMGYSRIIITKGDEPGAYSYLHEMTLQQPGGVLITAEATATLDDQFAPSVVSLTRVLHMPDGQRQSQVSRLEVHEAHLALSTDEDGQVSEREVPHPKVPFVFGVECLLESIDLVANPTFTFNELNPQDGTTQQLNYTVQAVEGGFDVTATVDGSGAPSEDAYMLDGEGMFRGMRMVTAPLEEWRISEAEYNELKATLGS